MMPKLPFASVRLVAALAGLLMFGVLSWVVGWAGIARWSWAACIAATLLALLLSAAVRLRQGEFGLDVIAALAMAGALPVGGGLAGGPGPPLLGGGAAPGAI